MRLEGVCLSGWDPYLAPLPVQEGISASDCRDPRESVPKRGVDFRAGSVAAGLSTPAAGVETQYLPSERNCPGGCRAVSGLGVGGPLYTGSSYVQSILREK